MITTFPPDEDFSPGWDGKKYEGCGLPKERTDRSKGETPAGGPNPYYDHDDTAPISGNEAPT